MTKLDRSFSEVLAVGSSCDMPKWIVTLSYRPNCLDPPRLGWKQMQVLWLISNCLLQAVRGNDVGGRPAATKNPQAEFAFQMFCLTCVLSFLLY